MKKVVVIEDNLDVRENITEILELDDYQVYPSENGKKGVATVKQELPDLIICDIMMPELDGYGVLHMLQKNRETASIPFIFLTAKAEKSDFRKGMQLGADDYLTKPFTDLELLETVESRLKKSHRIKEYVNSQNPEQSVNILLKETELNADNIDDLINNRKVKTLNKGDVIFHEGDSPVYLYLIKKGKVKTFKINDDGKEFVTNLYHSGDFLGYRALLSDADFNQTAECMEPTELLLIPENEFKTLIHQSREIGFQFMKLLSKNINEHHDELLKLAYDTVRKRVASALVRLYDKFKTENDQDPFTIQLSREDLASMVGTATESVIRMLSEFKSDGWVSIKGSQITINDVEALKNMRF